MHGGADRDVDPGQTLALATALQRLGQHYELVIFAGDSHVLPNHRRERDAHAAAWFRAYFAR
jgi:dipeptidyl aminopeptidase/acylaminoacyl peptidase